MSRIGSRRRPRYYRESLAIAREIGDRRGQVRAAHNLAIIQRETGDLTGARAGYEESIATRKQMGDTRGQVFSRVELGMVQLQQADLEGARATQNEVLRLSREIKLKPGEAQAQFQLGEIALAAGDFALARTQHEAGLALRREMQETRTIVESEVALANITLEEGHAADALREVDRIKASLGQETARIAPDVDLIAARAKIALKDTTGSAKLLDGIEKSIASTERVGPRYGLALARADLDAIRGRGRDARDRLAALRPALQKSGLTLIDLECRLRIVTLDRSLGRTSAADDARALEKDAHARGAELIARRAAGR